MLAAYRAGVFPMPAAGVLGVVVAGPAGCLPLDGWLRCSRSLRKSCGRFEIRIDTAFDEVIDGVRRPAPAGRRGSPRYQDRLHPAAPARLGPQRRGVGRAGELAGGLYGVAIGGLFAGESMFHRQTDASKVALVALVGLLEDGRRLPARRAVGHPPPAYPSARSRSAAAATTSCWRRPWPGLSPLCSVADAHYGVRYGGGCGPRLAAARLRPLAPAAGGGGAGLWPRRRRTKRPAPWPGHRPAPRAGVIPAPRRRSRGTRAPAGSSAAPRRPHDRRLGPQGGQVTEQHGQVALGRQGGRQGAGAADSATSHCPAASGMASRCS